MDLTGLRALTFDCYGTLVDWETGILEVLRPWAEECGLEVADEDLLAAFADAESRCQAETPGLLYPDILRRVLAEIALLLGGVPAPEYADALARSVGDWPPFPDTTPALRRLSRRYALVIVSNVDRASFERTRRRLGVRFDFVVLAEDVGVYKPDPRMFEQAIAWLAGRGIARGEILHVAQSLYHDHVPAKRLALATAWVDRRAGRSGGAARAPAETVVPDLTVASLAELADRLGASAGR